MKSNGNSEKETYAAADRGAQKSGGANQSFNPKTQSTIRYGKTALMSINSYIVYFGILAMGLSCSVPSNDIMAIEQNPNQEKSKELNTEVLTIIGTASYQMEIGFGVIFKLSVEQIVEGELTDESLSLVVIESALTDQLVRSDGQQLTFTFNLHQRNFEESRMTESGTLDSNRTAWKLINIE